MTLFHMRCVKCHKTIEWEAKSSAPIPECPHCATAKKESSPEVEEALALVDDIRDAVDQLPSRAQDFAESVMEKASDIGANIERHQRVTAGQLTALRNMLDGCQRWLD